MLGCVYACTLLCVSGMLTKHYTIRFQIQTVIRRQTDNLMLRGHFCASCKVGGKYPH